MTRCPSPNYNARPPYTTISLILLHYTDMISTEASLERLCDPRTEVSAHYLIDEDGVVYQMVDEEKRAWHAGVSSWNGKSNVNDFSIGIELQNQGRSFFEKTGTWREYPPSQIKTLVNLLNDLCTRYPLAQIVGHEHVAPLRKSDPGPHFDWGHLRFIFRDRVPYFD